VCVVCGVCVQPILLLHLGLPAGYPFRLVGGDFMIQSSDTGQCIDAASGGPDTEAIRSTCDANNHNQRCEVWSRAAGVIVCCCTGHAHWGAV
jgi:hypothetical protein